MWMKVDDRLHAHRKTRAVTKSHPDKRRDVAPMGLWVAAGSWSAQNGTDGWVPEDDLDRWDDEWKMLAARLVDGGYWWVEDRDGEPGYGFHDWHDYNFPTEAASASGTFGNHVRWHEKRGIADPECEHCPQEPDGGDSLPDVAPDSGGDVGSRSGGDIGGRFAKPIGGDRSTQPDPIPYPTQKDSAKTIDADFAEWYSHYPKKVAKGAAIKAYRTARKKVDAATLLGALKSHLARMLAGDPKFIPNPATWLNGERWEDQSDLPTPANEWMRR